MSLRPGEALDRRQYLSISRSTDDNIWVVSVRPTALFDFFRSADDNSTMRRKGVEIVIMMMMMMMMNRANLLHGLGLLLLIVNIIVVRLICGWYYDSLLMRYAFDRVVLIGRSMCPVPGWSVWRQGKQNKERTNAIDDFHHKVNLKINVDNLMCSVVLIVNMNMMVD